MLQVTEAATTAFRAFMAQEAPQAKAIRIQAVSTPEGQSAISFQPAQGPEEGDKSTEAPGLDVFISSELIDPLGQAVLDARETPEGAEVFLRSQEQQQGGPSPA